MFSTTIEDEIEFWFPFRSENNIIVQRIVIGASIDSFWHGEEMITSSLKILVAGFGVDYRKT